MQKLSLKSTHKPVNSYYNFLANFRKLGISHESAVRSAFQNLLESCCSQFGWTLIPEWKITRYKTKRILRLRSGHVFVDGAIVDGYKLPHGFWEAKDVHDDLKKEIEKKFDAGYPKDNILFQTPERAILWQNSRQVLDADLTQPIALISVLKLFFEYRPPQIEEWEKAVAEFKDQVPGLANVLIKRIKVERATGSSNTRFIAAFKGFMDKCRQTINLNLSEQAVEEMLIQHLLTERIFRKVFDNPDFTRRNAIAREIEIVIDALASHAFNRHDFLKQLDRFYVAIERTAATIEDFSQKQGFLNTVYEQFFQGFSVKVADTHGIVYTPQPLVDFMVKSVEEILQNEFSRSISDQNVHIIDPFVGTGNFILRVMQAIDKTKLQPKYQHELHCNEVMLLPYYIASMNIEHKFFELTEKYLPFEGICLVDTFDLFEGRQGQLFVEENTARVKNQTQTPMFVVIGNPPYNASQVNENDNNKNRKYEKMDERISKTYAADSKATLLNKLYDPYVKAIRWASDRIGDEGIVAFVTNNSFIDAISFDGMRKHLMSDFSKIYHINFKGNARTSGERRRKEAGNVFDDKIRVGVGITFFVKKKDTESSKAEVWIYSIDDYLKSKAKKDFLIQSGSYTNVPMKKVSVDKKYNWLTEGLRDDFETFVPMGTKKAKRAKGLDAEVIFKTYSLGVATNRDKWVYDFDSDKLEQKVQTLIHNYNFELARFSQENNVKNIDDFVNNDPSFVKWTDRLKKALQQHKKIMYEPSQIRRSLYRPFVRKFLYFDHLLNQRRCRQYIIFPTQVTETENRVICVPSRGSKQIAFFMTNIIPDLNFFAGSTPIQCFPFYVYDEDGTNRRENITDWALEQFRKHYQTSDPSRSLPSSEAKGSRMTLVSETSEDLTKWDIFHYIYALLHHPKYRDRFSENLKRELPRIPFAEDFWRFVKAGERLAELHVFYDKQPEYPLQMVEDPDRSLDWQVEKMRLSKDKTSIIYNNFLTLAGIPSKAFEYRLGNRSAVEWLIDRYRVKTDKRSGIVNNPNRDDEPNYIVRLIGQVISVSLETVAIVDSLPEVW